MGAFDNLFTKEERESHEYWRLAQANNVTEAEEMSPEQLANRLENTLKNLTAIPHYHQGAPIYEAQLIQTLIPEVIKRLREK